MLNWCRFDQLAVLVAVYLTLQSLAQRAVRYGRDARTLRPDLASALLLGLALTARLATPPALLHSNFHAYGLMDAVLDFPNPSMYRASFGQASFAVLGAIASAFGRDLSVVIHANAALQTLALALAAQLAGRVAGPWAARGTLAAGVPSPVMLRVAASEDAHNFAVLAGLLALLWADTWRREGGDATDALGLLGALFLCVDARQGMLLWPAFAAALALRGGRRPVTPRGVIALMALGLVLLIPVLVARLHDTGDRISYVGYTLAPLLCQGPTFWRQHPLLNDAAVLPLLGLAVLGAYVEARRSVAVQVLTAAAVTTLVLTYAVSCAPMPREAAYQRLGLLMLVAILAGVGVGALAQRASSAMRGGLLASCALLALLAASAVRVPRLWSVTDPFYQEIALLRRHLRSRGPTTLVMMPTSSGNDLTMGITARLIGVPGLRVVTPDSEDARAPGALRYQGLSCFALPFESCAPARRLAEFHSAGVVVLNFRRVFLDLTTHGPRSELFEGCAHIAGAVPACRQPIQRGVFEPWGSLEIEQDQLPVTFFSARRVTIGVWRDPPAPHP